MSNELTREQIEERFNYINEHHLKWHSDPSSIYLRDLRDAALRAQPAAPVIVGAGASLGQQVAAMLLDDDVPAAQPEGATPEEWAASRCPSCGQQMRGIDWIERLIAERDAARSELAAKWVSVAERLPEEDGEYLVSVKPMLGVESFVKSSPYKRQAHASINGFRYGRVTHWQPLPAPPAEWTVTKTKKSKP